MRDIPGHCLLQILHCHRNVLAGQAVHQVEIDVREPGGFCCRDRRAGIGGVMDAPKRAQALVAKTLHTERQAVYAGCVQRAEPVAFGTAGVGLERDLHVRREIDRRGDTPQCACEDGCGEQARRSAAEEQGAKRAAFDQVAVCPQIRQQAFGIGRKRRLRFGLVGIEITVGTLALAPG